MQGLLLAIWAEGEAEDRGIEVTDADVQAELDDIQKSFKNEQEFAKVVKQSKFCTDEEVANDTPPSECGDVINQGRLLALQRKLSDAFADRAQGQRRRGRGLLRRQHRQLRDPGHPQRPRDPQRGPEAGRGGQGRARGLSAPTTPTSRRPGRRRRRSTPRIRPPRTAAACSRASSRARAIRSSTSRSSRAESASWSARSRPTAASTWSRSSRTRRPSTQPLRRGIARDQAAARRRPPAGAADRGPERVHRQVAAPDQVHRRGDDAVLLDGFVAPEAASRARASPRPPDRPPPVELDEPDRARHRDALDRRQHPDRGRRRARRRRPADASAAGAGAGALPEGAVPVGPDGAPASTPEPARGPRERGPAEPAPRSVEAAAALAPLRSSASTRSRGGCAGECPWDREQDERSIVPHTVEEAYELADAAASGDDAKLLDELGDVLFQVHFLGLLLEERGAGDLAAVAEQMTEKLIRRHPHVFGEGPRPRAPARCSRTGTGSSGSRRAASGLFADVPENLPALLHARKLQRRAANRAPEGAELGVVVGRGRRRRDRLASSRCSAELRELAAAGADGLARDRSRGAATRRPPPRRAAVRGRRPRPAPAQRSRAGAARGFRALPVPRRRRVVKDCRSRCQRSTTSTPARSSTPGATRRSRSTSTSRAAPRPRRGALRRLDRRVRGDRAARRRRRLWRQGRGEAVANVNGEIVDALCGADADRPGGDRPDADRARRHPEQVAARRQRDPRRLARRRPRRRRGQRHAALPATWRRSTTGDPEAPARRSCRCR